MISGSIMSSDCQSGTFCLAQLRNVWQHMRTNMKLSLEEQSFFIMSSMYNLLNVSYLNAIHSLPSGYTLL